MKYANSYYKPDDVALSLTLIFQKFLEAYSVHL